MVLSPAAFSSDDGGIYDPSIPREWTFVRFVSKGRAADLTAQIDDKVISFVDNAVSQYMARAPGLYSLTVNGKSEELAIEPSQFLTIVLDPSSAKSVIIHDNFTQDPAKCSLALYNITKQPLSLTALAKRTPVLENVASLSGASRAVNAVSIDLNVEASGEILKSFRKTLLRRRSVTSIFVFSEKPDDILLTLAAAKN
ncbi:hypothetical protein AX760_23160 [Pararhizobium antarcticum]|uniref:Alginate biosynthesis protein AlgF n=1 Tax=Pararhizobium antarcticum TaxID=1798805 RepID=A0A657LRD3_9HYPH|nr:hypothetical protein AX760_23160 [Pararhizobium antarcticum]OJF96125.1 hypothetical protein AX761_16315 [Rhizobium sp. 58]